MRIPTPCTQNLDAMPRATAGIGVHCTACDRDVVDLRRTPKKRALAVLAELRARDGRVCVRVRATPDGAPVFARDPSPFARFALPAALAGSLAACAPSASADRGTAPTAALSAPSGQVETSGSSVATVLVRPAPHPSGGPVVTAVSHAPAQQPGVAPTYVEIEMAGDMAFDGP